jgi:hypothetical protein
LSHKPAIFRNWRSAHVAIRRQHRDRLAHVLCGSAVHDRAVTHLDVPCAGTGRDDECAAAEPHHAGLERGQRAQRRVQEQQAEDPARERPGLRAILEPLREREQVDDVFARKVGEIEKAAHGSGSV